MKRSIRLRFTLIFMGLTAFLLLATWFINTWWLEDFYMMEKVRTMERAVKSLDQTALSLAVEDKNIIDEYQRTYRKDSETQGSIQQLFRILSENFNLTLVFQDSLTDKLLLPNSRDAEVLANRIQRYIFEQNSPKTDIIKEHEDYKIQKSYDQQLDSYYLESWGYLSDRRTIFLMSTPLASIRESVDLSNKFLGYVGLATLLFSSIILFFTTKKITYPILSLAKLSEKISNLDFDAKYTGDAEDEIGVLGNSMNILSDKLRETIGELKSANLELQKDIEEKIKVDEMRKDFIANVSHELKTPISLIQGYAEGLAEGMCEDEESRSYYCEVIMDEAGKMNTLVRQLLNLTALEFGNDAPSMERFNLTELIQGVLQSASILLNQKEAVVELDVPGPVYVWADEFKIEEVVTNYLSNALNHLGGERHIRITVEPGTEEAKVTVYNDGPRIPDADLPNLWTKFYKVDKSHTREYGGSGIGLSIVKAIMDSHHKTCGVQNKENGVAFWFTLDCRNG